MTDKIRILIIVFLLGLTINADALPAFRDPVKRLTDTGDSLIVTLQGDHWLHYYLSEDGRHWKENKNGLLEQLPALSAPELLEIRNSRRKAGQAVSTATPLNIAPRGLVILANFKDVKFNEQNTVEAMTEMLNGDNYTYNNATGSARRYFIDQSNGEYAPYFDVVGPVTLSKDMDYYGEDDNSAGYEGEDLHAVDMIVEACRLADSKFGVDFTKYDCDNDGEVDFVFVIYAGYNQAEGGPANTIWPHAFWVSDYHGKMAGGITCVLDGKKINTYACGSELRGKTGTTRCGVGTFCHEFSHVLGLPDLYVTSGSSNHRTQGSWDILDYGPYNNDGRTPPAYSAYERFFCGWLTPVILNSQGTYQLRELQESNSAAIITSTGSSNLKGNDPDPTEFYLIENRQQTGWDKYLKGHGMMITKISYTYSAWYYNTVNNSKNAMGVDIIEAKTNNSISDKATDLFPAGADAYTPYETYPITNITEIDSIITFDFMGGGDTVALVGELEDDMSIVEQVRAIYNLQGYRFPVTATLKQGIYIIVTNKSARKIFVP